MSIASRQRRSANANRIAKAATLVEYVESSKGLKVDREKGIIYGVKFLGWKSENNRDYDPAGVRAEQYEGVVSNINHTRPGATTSTYDRFGIGRNAEKRADGVYGNLHYLKTHPMAGVVTEAAERSTDGDLHGVFGMSHTADGNEVRGRDGRRKVESINKVITVDVVADPATVKGLRESKGYATMLKKRKVKAILEDALKNKPVQLKRLREADVDQYPSMAADIDVPEDGDGEDAAADAFDALLCAVFGDFRDGKIEMADAMKKVKQIFSIADESEDDADGGDDDGDGADGDGEDAAPEEESRTLKAQMGQLKEEMAIRDLLEESPVVFANTKARKVFVKSLLPLSESERKELIQERQAASKIKAPRSVGPTITKPPTQADRQREAVAAGSGGGAGGATANETIADRLKRSRYRSN